MKLCWLGRLSSSPNTKHRLLLVCRRNRGTHGAVRTLVNELPWRQQAGNAQCGQYGPEAIKLQSGVLTKSSEHCAKIDFLYFFLISSPSLQFDSNLCLHAAIAHALHRSLPLPHFFSSAVFLPLLPVLQHYPSGIIPYLPLHLCMLLPTVRAFQCQLSQRISPCLWCCRVILPWSGDVLWTVGHVLVWLYPAPITSSSDSVDAFVFPALWTVTLMHPPTLMLSSLRSTLLEIWILLEETSYLKLGKMSQSCEHRCMEDRDLVLH